MTAVPGASLGAPAVSPLGVPYLHHPLGLGTEERSRLLADLLALDPEPYWAEEEQPRDDGRVILSYRPDGSVVEPLGGDAPSWGMLLLDTTTGAVRGLRPADRSRR